MTAEDAGISPGLSGRCLCGGVRWTAAAPLWTALCHCESCRRAASAPVVAWIGFRKDAVSWTGARRIFRSSPGVERSFCPTCGTPLSFESTRWPGELHLYAASMDDPSAYRPQLHCHHAERLAWLHIADDLPKFDGSAEPDR